MVNKFIRVYQEIDIQDVKTHSLIFGDLSGNCSQCKAISIKLSASQCPECQTTFKYIAFRNMKSHQAKVHKIKAERPSLILIDYDDYKIATSISKAEELFG